MQIRPRQTLDDRLIEQLYLEAMILADEVKSYFEHYGRDERDDLPAFAQIEFACESLRLTTRLMHVIAWLLTRRAVSAGEITAEQGAMPERRLGAVGLEPDARPAILPDTARQLSGAVADLHARVARLDAQLATPVHANAAHAMIARLQRSF